MLFLAHFSEPLQPGCDFALGEEIAPQLFWGDADCDFNITLADVLWILLESAGTPFPVPTGCLGVGEPID